MMLTKTNLLVVNFAYMIEYLTWKSHVCKENILYIYDKIARLIHLLHENYQYYTYPKADVIAYVVM